MYNIRFKKGSVQYNMKIGSEWEMGQKFSCSADNIEEEIVNVFKSIVFKVEVEEFLHVQYTLNFSTAATSWT